MLFLPTYDPFYNCIVACLVDGCVLSIHRLFVRGPFIISLYVLIKPYLANVIYRRLNKYAYKLIMRGGLGCSYK